MRRTPPAPLPPASRSGSIARRSRKASRVFPGSPTACSRSGAKTEIGPRAVRQRFESHQCRQRGTRAGELPRHLLDCRRLGEDRRHHEPHRILPAHRQGLSDRRSRQGVRRHARWQGRATRSRTYYRPRSPPPRATRKARRPRSRWCSCRLPAPVSTSTRISRCAAKPSPIWCWRSRVFLPSPALAGRGWQAPARREPGEGRHARTR